MSQNILKEFNMFSKKFKLNEEIYSQKCKELLIIEIIIRKNSKKKCQN